MAKVEGLNRVQAKLKQLEKKYGADSKPAVVVGFTQAYAVYVHENLEAKHPVGQAKFLEQPARQHGKRIGGLVQQAVTKGKTLEQGLLIGGLFLQREAQQLTPVDTAALKNSAFTAKEADLEAASQAAYENGESFRQRGQQPNSRGRRAP